MDALAEHVTTVHVEPAAALAGPSARAWCRASRAALLGHPGVLALAMTKPPRGSAAAAIREQTEQLRRGGARRPAGRRARDARLRLRQRGRGGAAHRVGGPEGPSRRLGIPMATRPSSRDCPPSSKGLPVKAKRILPIWQRVALGPLLSIGHPV